MKIKSPLVVSVLLACALAAGPALAAAPSGETAQPTQPFSHPSNDASYSKDVQQDVTSPMQEDEVLAKAKPMDNGKVQYISGGVAESGMRAIDAEEKAYNLKILFVAGKAYLADVDVRIKDSKGDEVLDTATHGPVLLVKMPMGMYTVETKTMEGAMLTKHIKVGKDYLASYVLRYPAEKQ